MTLELKFVSILGLSYSSLLIPFFHPFFLRSFFSSPLNDKKMNYLLYWYYLFSFLNWLMCFITLFFLMKSSWRTILYLLQAYHIVIQHCSILGVLIIVLTICTTQCYITLLTTVFPVLYFMSMCIMYFITASLYLVIPFTSFSLPPTLSSGNHQFIMCIYESFLFLFICFCF